MSAHNIYFHGEIRKKISTFFVENSALSGAMFEASQRVPTKNVCLFFLFFSYGIRKIATLLHWKKS